MPIYEFYCPKTDTIYSFLSQRLIGQGEIPRCPENARYRMERVVSPFSVTGRHKDKEDGGDFGDDPDDPRMEAAMAEMEREMAGMEEENPDPRQVGRLMRRMADLTGEPLGGSMEEMVRKMEEGTDIDALEEEFGDALDDEDVDAPFGDGEAGGGDVRLRRMLKAARRRKGPRRDPVLYDWREYS